MYEFKGCHADFGLRGYMLLRTEILKGLRWPGSSRTEDRGSLKGRVTIQLSGLHAEVP